MRRIGGLVFSRAACSVLPSTKRQTRGGIPVRHQIEESGNDSKKFRAQIELSQESARWRVRSVEGDRLLHFPRWVAPINWGVALPLGHVVLPWWISLHSVRHGWSGGLPGGWNLIAILPVGTGLVIIVWALGLHFVF